MHSMTCYYNSGGAEITFNVVLKLWAQFQPGERIDKPWGQFTNSVVRSSVCC